MVKFPVFRSLTRYERSVDIKKLEFIYAAIERYIKESSVAAERLKILEIGCGDGSITLPLSTVGGAVTAFDIDDDLVRNLKQDIAGRRISNVTLSQGNAYQLANSERYHIAVASEVLEHVASPEKIVQNVRDHLLAGGYFIVTIPNGYGPWELKNRLMTTPSSARPDEPECGHKHVQFFTRGRFVNMMREQHFTLVDYGCSDAFSGLSYRVSKSKMIAAIDLTLADILPHWMASGWYFVFRKNPGSVLPMRNTSSPEQNLIRERLREVFLKTNFKFHTEAQLNSDEGKNELEDHLTRRYDRAVQYTIPWLKRCVDLTGKTVLEIGCGSGSITAALAPQVHRIHAYDIHDISIEAARARIGIHGLQNVSFYLVDPGEILQHMRTRFQSDKVDVIIMYALLEHQTIAERIETLKTAWDIASDDGVILVGEAPNRFSLYDDHSSMLHFYHMLPDELALLYYARSPREGFKKAISDGLSVSRENALERLARFGRGVSYHEFELAFGDIADHVMLDGFEPEILKHRGGIKEEEIFLYNYFITNALPLSPAFAKRYLDVVISKKKTVRPRKYGSRLLKLEHDFSTDVTVTNGVKILATQRAQSGYHIPHDAEEIILYFIRHPHGGLLRVIEQTGKCVCEEPTYDPETRGDYMVIKNDSYEKIIFNVRQDSIAGRNQIWILSVYVR